nr:MAG TPA: hypothetical protein [Caudoviricetes sp.]
MLSRCMIVSRFSPCQCPRFQRPSVWMTPNLIWITRVSERWGMNSPNMSAITSVRTL